MKKTDFAEHLASFLTAYLPGQKGYSTNTIMSYRDTFKQTLIFAEDQCGIPSEKFRLANFNEKFVDGFMTWLEKDRACGRATRNQRLSAIHAFVKYVKRKDPGYLFECQRILDIQTKKAPETILPYLTPDFVREILAQANLSNRYGRRDAAMLSLLYDSGARVQEICDLRMRDIRIQKPSTVTLTGKGDKMRVVPIMGDTATLLGKYIAENDLLSAGKLDYPLFINHQHAKLTRAGVAYLLKKYCDAARKENPVIPQLISPHVIRHSKAMHMLQSGVNLIYIRDFLGHAHVKTTEVYARADTEMKRTAIENAHIRMEQNLPDWENDKPLMTMLTELCR